MRALRLGQILRLMAIAYFPRLALLVAVASLGACATIPNNDQWPYPEPPENGGDWGYQGQNRQGQGDSPDGRGSQSGSNGGYTPPYGSPDNPQTREQQQPEASRNPSVQALVDQSDRERDAGDLDRASGTLERAIRIVNDDPLPWLKLAEIRFEQGNMIQAENLARRSISFDGYGPTARQSWLLIADIKRLQGDNAGARAAQDNAQR